MKIINKVGRKLKIALLVFIPLILVCVAAFNTSLVTRYYNVASTQVNGSVRIALIADLHSCDYGLNQKVLMNAIDKESPDLVLMAGDIVDDVLPTDKAEEFFKAVTERYPCYYVSGNHEFWSGRIADFKQLIRSYGIKVLEGESVTVDVNESKISICGMDDPEVGENEFYSQLKNCGTGVDSNSFKVLLTHRPERIEDYLHYPFDLILAGHAHGGQWRIPGIINGIYAPDQGFFPQYAGGLYKFNHTDFIVSRGLSGESTRVPRIFNRPELVIIDIHPDE